MAARATAATSGSVLATHDATTDTISHARRGRRKSVRPDVRTTKVAGNVNMLEPSHAWQQATAANNIIQAMTPRPSLGHTSLYGPPMDARMHGHPKSRMTEKKKTLGVRERGTPTKMPEDFFQAMPTPKGARQYPMRPTQHDQVSARAQAAAMAVRDGLDASMPMDQRQMLYGNASKARPVGKPYTKTLIK